MQDMSNPRRTNKALIACIVAAFVLAAIALTWSVIEESSKTASAGASPKKVELKRGDKAKVKTSYFGFRTEDQLGRSVELAKADTAAFKKYLGEMAMSGDAVGLLPGDEVFVEARTLNSFVQIRLKGQTESWFTLESVFLP